VKKGGEESRTCPFCVGKGGERGGLWRKVRAGKGKILSRLHWVPGRKGKRFEGEKRREVSSMFLGKKKRGNDRMISLGKKCSTTCGQKKKKAGSERGPPSQCSPDFSGKRGFLAGQTEGQNKKREKFSSKRERETERGGCSLEKKKKKKRI